MSEAETETVRIFLITGQTIDLTLPVGHLTTWARVTRSDGVIFMPQGVIQWNWITCIIPLANINQTPMALPIPPGGWNFGKPN